MGPGYATGLKCIACSATFAIGEVEYACPKCGNNLDVTYDYAALKADLQENGFGKGKGMWQFKKFMPVDMDAEEPVMLAGGTPFYDVDRIAQKVGIRKVYIKDDGRNPTCSLKDRASALLAVKTKHEKRGIITTASTGNAGAALAGLCASLEVPCVIFVPKAAPIAKITQLVVYGAKVVLVDGSYDDAFDMCTAATKQWGWYCRNTGANAYTREGKKTVSLELCKQLGEILGKDYAAPDWVCVSVGDGNIITGIAKGLEDLYKIGAISQKPKLLGCQGEGSTAIADAFNKGPNCREILEVDACTIADSIAACVPRDGLRALDVVRESGGHYTIVNDDQIVEAIPELSRLSGVFPEPAASATYAGFKKAVAEGIIKPDESACLVITGNGLKDVATAQKSVSAAPVVMKGDMDSLKKTLKEVYNL